MTRSILSASLLGLSLFGATPARADDCPPGAVFRSQEGFSWCEPTVCQNDGQCKPSEVCRPLGLCMQVGSLNAGASLGDAGKRLVVTQQCAPDKTCPQTTVCSDLGRCLAKTTAEKMGLMAADIPPPPDKKKPGCGCHVVGGQRGPEERRASTAQDSAGLLFVLGAVLLSFRRARAGSRARAPRSR